MMSGPDFWLQKWQTGEIAFHRDQVHEALARHFSRLQLQPGQQVFVPLCGKSPDILWLARRGCRVLGVELSEIACQDFFHDNALEPQRSRAGAFQVFQDGQISLLCGDVFDLAHSQLEAVDAVYDRAALVALPAAVRRRYVTLLAAGLPPHVGILLVALDYEQERMQGPPFSVSQAEVRELFSERFEFSVVEERDVIDEEPRFKARGLPRLMQRVYLLEPGA